MPRHFWISASIAVLVAAFALLGMALSRMALVDEVSRGRSSASELAFQHQVVTYEVPPARADRIQHALNSVLQGAEGVPASGRAQLASPGQMVVSAPPRMHESIRQAIAGLTGGEAGQLSQTQSSVAVEMWLVEAASAAGSDDARLAPALAVLDVARTRFGHRHYRLLDRSMTVATPSDRSILAATGSRSTFTLELTANNGQTVDAEIGVRLMEQGRVSQLQAMLQLPAGQWQLVGLLPDAGGNSPERLLLVRQTAAGSSPIQEQ
jgi:hypothetical protein